MNNDKGVGYAPEIYMLIATFLLTLFGSAGKVPLPLVLIVSSRFIIPLILITATKILDLSRLKNYLKNISFVDFGRSICVVATQYAFFYCVKNTTLFNACVLLNTAPMFILIIYFFHDKSISINKIIAVTTGFVGVVCILKPGTDFLQNIALPIGLLSGFFWALSNVIQSNLLKKHSNEQCMFYYYFHGSCLSLILIALYFDTSWIPLYFNLKYFSVLLVYSFCTIGFQYFSGKAYKLKSVYHLAPFLYLTIFFSWGIDYLVFDEPSSLSSIIGAILIIASSFIARR